MIRGGMSTPKTLLAGAAATVVGAGVLARYETKSEGNNTDNRGLGRTLKQPVKLSQVQHRVDDSRRQLSMQGSATPISSGAMRADPSLAAISLRLRSKVWGIFPVVYAKEAENTVVTSGSVGPATAVPSKPLNERSNGTETAMDQNSVDNKSHGDTDAVDDDEDEDTTCVFCLFQRRGPCGRIFRSWEKCIARTKGTDLDYIGECAESTRMLMTCMEEHPEYYGQSGDADDDDTDASESPGFSTADTSDTVAASGVKNTEQPSTPQ